MNNCTELIVNVCTATTMITLTCMLLITIVLYFSKWIEKKFGKEDKQKEGEIKVCYLSTKAKKNLRSMLKKEYGLIPIVNRPKEEKEEGT